MKKSIIILLSIICIAGLVGCSNKKSDTTTSSQANTSVEQKQVDEKQVDQKQDVIKNDNNTKKQESNSTQNNSSKNKKTSPNTTIVNNSKQNIVTNDFNQVSSIEIIYNNSKTTYSVDKDKDFIKKVYDSILNTKVTVNKGSQESDPQFTINLVYKSGDKNVIESTETGEFIFRVLDNKSWVGGHNTDLIKIIKNKR